MRSVIVCATLALALSGAVSAWAGGSCCAKGKKDSARKSCSEQFSSLSLSDEQRARISEIEKACAEEGNSKEACEKYSGEIKKLLSAEQLKEWEAACQPARGESKAGS
jgi:hypothetical protein